MNKLNLNYVLKEEQKYVLDFFNETGKEIKGFRYDKATDTCFEKAELIGFDPKQVVKAIYLWDKDSRFYLFVAPELGTEENPLKFDQRRLSKIFRNLGYPGKIREEMSKIKNNGLPFGVEEGTCSPFVPEHYFDLGDGYKGFLEKIYVYNDLKLDGKISDISLGGEGEFFHKISAHLDYEDIYGCLNWRFPGKIEKFNL